MTLAVRLGIASLDDAFAWVRHNYPADGVTLVVSWDRTHQRAAAMGLLDDYGRPVDVPSASLQHVTGLIRHPFPADVLRLAYPDADLHLSGQVVLNLPVDEPVWSRVLSNVELKVQAGLRVSTEDVRDSVWATLEAAQLPSGSATLDRTVIFAELPDDLVFQPLTLSENQGGAGASVRWPDAVKRFPHPEVARALTSLLNELGVRSEQEQNLSGNKIVLTTAVVTI